jgi:hypothetical protein
LTVEPYAIANNLPFNSVSSLEVFDPSSPQLTSEFFSNGGTFSNQKVLIAWEHEHIPATVGALLSSYFPNGGAPPSPNWPDADYDSVWTLIFDATGNLTVDNATCEGIDSAALPVAAPQF